MKTSDKNELIELFEQHFDQEIDSFELLPPSGSYREYCRIQNYTRLVLGVSNADVKENMAFFAMTEHFLNKGLPVPKIFAVSSDKTKYLIEDLGDTTLFDFITKVREKEGFSETIINEYKKVLKLLLKLQIDAGKDFDYSVCYPRAAFDSQSIMWDLNYFKYYFLKLAQIPFDEQALEDDFREFSNYLLGADSQYFMYRDFQSRNIILRSRYNVVYFIDYQGGRRGPLQYDLASLLYDAKADVPENVRKELFDFYLKELQGYFPTDEKEFSAYFQGFALIRIMQAMGAYGFRGFYEKKEHFLKSIPYALKNLKLLLNNFDLPVRLPELTKVLQALPESEVLKNIGILTVNISSFSYKRGIPDDPSGNGGGFVFDCRAINNPGRFERYKYLTGKDTEIQRFLEENSEINIFMDSVKTLVEQSVKVYIERGFSNLSINFGCTGGRHRSVYSAEKLAEHLKNNFPVKVVVVHYELENQ